MGGVPYSHGGTPKFAGVRWMLEFMFPSRNGWWLGVARHDATETPTETTSQRVSQDLAPMTAPTSRSTAFFGETRGFDPPKHVLTVTVLTDLTWFDMISPSQCFPTKKKEPYDSKRMFQPLTEWRTISLMDISASAPGKCWVIWAENSWIQEINAIGLWIPPGGAPVS